MVKPVSNIVPGIKPISPVPGSDTNSTANGSINFGEVLNNMINSTNQMQQNSSHIGKLFAAGKIDDLHTVMIEGQRADLALQFILQVRNKVLDAYNEIMRMPI